MGGCEAGRVRRERTPDRLCGRDLRGAGTAVHVPVSLQGLQGLVTHPTSPAIQVVAQAV